MKNLAYVRVEAHIRAVTRDFERAIGLKGLGINVANKFIPAYKDEDHLVLADTESMWQYRDNTIRWFLPACARCTDTDIVEAVVHEYVHVLNAPLEKLLPEAKQTHDQLEFATETVAQAFLRLYRRGAH